MHGESTIVADDGGGASERDGRASGRIRNKWGQGDRLRGEILAAAGEELGELGTVEGLTLRGVARRAGIAPASVYTQFADKAALIRDLLAHEHGQVAGLMETAGAAADPADPAARIGAELEAFCRYSLANPGLYRIMFGPRVEPDDAPSGLGSLVEQMVATVRAAEAAGARLRVPADRAAIILLVAAHGRVAIHHSRPEHSTEDSVLQFAGELLGLILD
ncbi:MAG TPA: TetR/AcrR family transcriptional regulator [Trebonia sp.]|jgi:AcrR family transcriptional regulator